MGEIIPSMFSDGTLQGEYVGGTHSHMIFEMFDRDETGKLNKEKQTESDAVALSTALVFAKKPSLQKLDEVTQAVQEYIQACARKHLKPTVSGTALTLGLTRTNFLRLASTGVYKHPITGEEISVPEEVQYFCIYLRDNITSILESLLEESRIHPAGGIFLLKNNSEYKDVVQHDYNVTQHIVNTDALAQKYNLDFDE